MDYQQNMTYQSLVRMLINPIAPEIRAIVLQRLTEFNNQLLEDTPKKPIPEVDLDDIQGFNDKAPLYDKRENARRNRACAMTNESSHKACAMTNESSHKACAMTNESSHKACAMTNESSHKACAMTNESSHKACAMTNESSHTASLDVKLAKIKMLQNRLIAKRKQK